MCSMIGLSIVQVSWWWDAVQYPKLEYGNLSKRYTFIRWCSTYSTVQVMTEHSLADAELYSRFEYSTLYCTVYCTALRTGMNDIITLWYYHIAIVILVLYHIYDMSCLWCTVVGKYIIEHYSKWREKFGCKTREMENSARLVLGGSCSPTTCSNMIGRGVVGCVCVL